MTRSMKMPARRPSVLDFLPQEVARFTEDAFYETAKPARGPGSLDMSSLIKVPARRLDFLDSSAGFTTPARRPSVLDDSPPVFAEEAFYE